MLSLPEPTDAEAPQSKGWRDYLQEAWDDPSREMAMATMAMAMAPNPYGAPATGMMLAKKGKLTASLREKDEFEGFMATAKERLRRWRMTDLERALEDANKTGIVV